MNTVVTMNAARAHGNRQEQSPVSDQDLVRRYRQGDEQAFEQLIERYRLELFHFLIRFLSDRAAAEDVFQNTFMQVYLSLDSFDVSRRFRPWVFTIAANKARDWLRRNKQNALKQVSIARGDADEPLKVLDLIEADQVAPGLEVQDKEEREQVRQVVAELPEHLREILLLAYFQQFPYKQIAEVLGIPLGTVKSRLHAAVATFAELWRRRMEGSADDSADDDNHDEQSK